MSRALLLAFVAIAALGMGTGVQDIFRLLMRPVQTALSLGSTGPLPVHHMSVAPRP